MEYCYWCEKVATSREHVPPKCIFPEKKDIESVFGQNFRKDLITVPSCDEHNLKKSNDDEYLMAVLSGRVGNNGIAYVHNATKVNRTRKRNTQLLDVKESGFVNSEKNKYPVEVITLDNYRLIHSFEAIGRALFYHEFEKRFEGECKFISDIFVDFNKHSEKQFMTESYSILQKDRNYWKTGIKAENPRIFVYQFSEIDGFGTRTLYLRFFEKTEIFVIMREYIEKKMDVEEKNSFENSRNFAKKFADELFKGRN
ncbi:MAG: hypothetical protein PHY47_14805 [Lachnospiraceae bacterium]|nr:hypothetical protein [Lachnospiraceae bacterium]